MYYIKYNLNLFLCVLRYGLLKKKQKFSYIFLCYKTSKIEKLHLI